MLSTHGNKCAVLIHIYIYASQVVGRMHVRTLARKRVNTEEKHVHLHQEGDRVGTIQCSMGMHGVAQSVESPRVGTDRQQKGPSRPYGASSTSSSSCPSLHLLPRSMKLTRVRILVSASTKLFSTSNRVERYSYTNILTGCLITFESCLFFRVNFQKFYSSIIRRYVAVK